MKSKSYYKQIFLCTAIGLLLIAVVFIVVAFTPLENERVFANGVRQQAAAVTEAAQREQPVNINTAGKAELMRLPEIGEVRAESILAYREAHGAFQSPEDILKVNGIGEKTYEAIKDLICTK